MTAQSDPYVRVYYRIIDDPKFEAVFNDDRALATWLRLLLTADATYPAPAPVPHGIHRATFDKLIQVGLIDSAPAHRYRMHGLAAERDRRSDQARNAANARHGKSGSNARAMREQSVSNAAASDDDMHSAPIRAEQLRATPSRTATEHYAALEEVTLLPMQRVEARTRTELDRLADQRGAAAVALAIREVAERIPTQPPSARQVVFEAVKFLEPFTANRTEPKPKGLQPGTEEVASAFRS